MTDTLSVSAIKNGTVIDHITAGQALKIIRLLNLHTYQDKVTIGMQLSSKRIGKKDLIKIENRFLTDDEANEIVVFAPMATINIIQSFNVTKKFNTRLPELMKNVFICPNTKCISRVEPVSSCFKIGELGKQILLTCRYCEKTYDRDDIQVGL